MAFTKVAAAGISTGNSLTIQELNTVGVITAATVQVGSATTIHTTGIDLGGGNITSHNINSTGIITATGAVITGNLEVQGTTTTLDSLVTEVDKLEVAANNTNVAVAVTQSGTGDILRLYDGATQAVTVADGGSVGIGLTDPGERLNVVGSIKGQAGSTNFKAYNPSTSSGNPEFVFTQNTTVGEKSVAYISAERQDSGSNYYSSLVLGTTLRANDATKVQGIVFRNRGDNNSYLKLKTDGTDAIHIDGSQRVGIGTDNPDVKLKVNIASGNDGIVVQNTSTANIALVGARNGDATLQIGQWGSTASGTTFGLSNANLAFVYTTTYSSTHPSALALGTVSNTPIVFATNNSERLRITSSGSIECKGETDIQNNILRVTDATPRIILSVPSGGLDSRLYNDGSGNFIIGHGTNSDAPTERLRITSDGKIGLAGVTPQNVLDLGSGTNNRGISWGGTDYNYVNIWTEYGTADLHIGTGIRPDGTNTGWVSSYGGASTGRTLIKSDYSAGDLTFHTAPASTVADGSAVTVSERLRITSDGGVVIGGSSRANRLTVVGPSASQSGANSGTVTDAVAMFYGGKRTTIATNNHIDTAIVHIKGQITDNDTNSTGTHSTGQIVFSGRRATGAQSIIESATVWDRNNQTAGSHLRFYTAPVSSNGETAAQERLRINANGRLGIGTDNPSTYKLDINHLHTEQGLRVRSRYGNIATAMVKFDTDPTSDGGDGNVLHIHGGNSRTDSEIVTIDGTGPGNILHVRGDGLIRTYKNVELQNASLLVTGNSSYDQQTSIFSYNTHSATGHRPAWHTFCKFIQTVSSGTYLKIPFVYQGNYYTRTYIRIRGISAQYNSATPKAFLFEGAYGHLTGMNSSTTLLSQGNISSITSHNGTSASDPPHIRLNFTSAYTGATNQGVDIFLEWFTATPGYSIQPDEIVLN